ncbi:hypothetical protein QVD17_02110 [Tagetes erecta]|uniref:Integrase catalytic domain-containing protein n=1 Tax=Tagetes erecta TaxID=13708 RepID=A0AAD8LC04_TARER|nr:hypothetical protein QVD17_02110 [Tagetes erecta]
MVERQFSTKVKHVQTDWGGEFRPLTSFFASLGIIHQLSCPHTSEQNGIVERRHRHVVETGLTLMAQSAIPKRFWHFAFDTAVYLINRMPSRTTSRISPFEHIFHRSPNFNYLRVFGCQCFPHLRPYNPHKMDLRSTPCIFLGYSPSHHGYRCLDPTSDRIYIARHVRFNEHFFPFSQSSQLPSTPSPVDNTYTSFSEYTNIPFDNPTPNPTHITPPSSPSTQLPPSPPITSSSSSHSSTPHPPPRTRPPNLRQNPKPRVPYSPTNNHVSTSPTTIPTSFTIANQHPEWRQAMAEEFTSLIKNGTWSLVPPPPNTNVIDCKWLYRLKTDQNNARTRYKARLVARGFRQQQDVQNAFLHGSLKESVYIKQPQGFTDPQRPDHVCLLHKSLYGLKQAPRVWFEKFSQALHRLGFHSSKANPSLFIYKSGKTIIYILVYVDDIIVTGNDSIILNSLITKLGDTFAIKDLGNLEYFLGIELIPQQSGILLSQRKYITEVLQRAGLSDAKPVSNPMSTTQLLSLGDSPLFPEPARYREIVGSLQYVTLSRPDIAFAVNKVCQYMHAPSENHWSAVIRILRYLKGTLEFGLLIRHKSNAALQAFTDVHWQGNAQINAYSDADWAGCPDDRRSTGGYAIYLGSNLISWTARKQKTVSRSSTESEYKDLADTVTELIWIEALLDELGIHTKISPTLWCDNLGATYLAANPIFRARTKHVEIDYHFVRERVAQGKIKVQFISTHVLTIQAAGRSPPLACGGIIDHIGLSII